MELVLAYNARKWIRYGAGLERAISLTTASLEKKRLFRQLDNIYCHVELGKRKQWILGWYTWLQSKHDEFDDCYSLDFIVQVTTNCRLLDWHEVDEHSAVLVINGIVSYEKKMNPEMADSIIYKDWQSYLTERAEIESNLSMLRKFFKKELA